MVSQVSLFAKNLPSLKVGIQANKIEKWEDQSRSKSKEILDLSDIYDN